MLPNLHLLKLGPTCATEVLPTDVRKRSREALDRLSRTKQENQKKKGDEGDAEMSGPPPRPRPPYGEQPASEPASETEEPEEPEEPGGVLKMLVIGFDGTMTVLSVDENGKPSDDPTSKNASLFLNMTKGRHIRNFGGQSEVDKMKDIFERVLKKGIEIRILSYGYKAAIQFALGAAGLADYFTDTNVEGMPAPEDGSRIFGNEVPPLDDPESFKGSVVSEWLDDYDLDPNQVAFLDDDDANIGNPNPGPDSKDTGVAQILEAGYARMHDSGKPFSTSIPWIEKLCGL